MTQQRQTAYINFFNIRYAAPPVGQRRWAPPEPPLDERGAGPIQTTSARLSCPQSAQNWVPKSLQSLGDAAKDTIPLGVPEFEESEDCLFLDVSTPQKAFQGARGGERRLSPVLVYIHGGGFVLGGKTLAHVAGGLFQQAENDVVFVSMAYRVSVEMVAFALGFLEHCADNRIAWCFWVAHRPIWQVWHYSESGSTRSETSLGMDSRAYHPIWWRP